MDRRYTPRQTYVLQEGSEGIPFDDISVVEEPMIDRIDTAWPGAAEPAMMPFPCAVASADKGIVRRWCEGSGVTLRPHEFIGGQVDYIIELNSAAERAAFKRKWLR